MDQSQCSRFFDFLKEVPDPRGARGKRYPWEGILAIIALGLAQGQKTVWGIARWAQLHSSEILGSLAMAMRGIPSAGTFYRALRGVDMEALEKEGGAYGQEVEQELHSQGQTEESQGCLRGQAVDGKELRGTGRYGTPVRLVSLVQHGSGTVLGECQVADKASEVSALPALLEGRDLAGIVITLDALYTRRPVAQQILDHGGHYLMMVKGNQPTLLEALETLFQEPPLPGEARWEDTQWHKEHGRLEMRQVVASELLNDYLGWPGVGQVVQRTCFRITQKSQKQSKEVSYAVTSATHEQATAQQLALFWREHWTIENKSHYVRDETLGEDRAQIHVGHAPQALAVLRNGLLAALRHQGWTNIADALRAHEAPTAQAFSLLGIPTRPVSWPKPKLQLSPTFQRLWQSPGGATQNS
jgi:predicted transposase YbfD/YdcC